MEKESKIVIKVGFISQSKLVSEKVYVLKWEDDRLPNANNFLDEIEQWMKSDPKCEVTNHIKN